jgi:hypothetical protein
MHGDGSREVEQTIWREGGEQFFGGRQLVGLKLGLQVLPRHVRAQEIRIGAEQPSVPVLWSDRLQGLKNGVQRLQIFFGHSPLGVRETTMLLQQISQSVAHRLDLAGIGETARVDC